MKKITITWKKIAKGEALPCDSFIRSIDDTVHSKVYFCSRGVTVGQNAYFLPAREFYDWQTDERIRKSLIDFLSQCKACYGDVFKRFGIDIDDALAWLEKQKEFVSADFDDVWETAGCEELTAPLEKYSKEAIKKMCHAWYDKGIELERRKWLEKQGEQKPTEWSDEDENGLNTAIQHIENYVNNTPSSQRPEIWADITKLKSLKDRVQPKQEWSEEDKMMLQYAIEHFEIQKRNSIEGGLRKKSMQEFIDWFKDLKNRVLPQPKQEWSEEDKKHVHSIISTIECCRKENERSKVIADAYTSDLEWFKSLMNRCKPSEDLPHWKKGTLKGKNVTGFNSDFFSHNGYYINYNELFDKLPKDE